MHRHVGAAVEQAALEVGGEPSLPLELIDRCVGPITFGPDDEGLEVPAAGCLQGVRRQRRLSERERASTRGQSQR